MGRKIFISYKYGDSNVCGDGATVRDYVDDLQELLDKEDHVNKGESDDSDLSDLSDETIRQKLADRMFDSTVTIVLISPNMKEPSVAERNQWIPWEVSYSLRTENREVGKSYPNAMIAVVLPDTAGSYGYYFEENICPRCDARTQRADKLFPILGNNMFNLKNPNTEARPCHNGEVSTGEHSYISAVKWDEFVKDVNGCIDRALKRQRNRDDYEINTQLSN